ncbi:hypothetical protein [Chitinophaga sp. CF118]|uniref:hypothetical protein n=1 Tax=Chitinophaga sp. CF118 TaxID=1884367 RepID=UPI0011603F18|nr:hypothetical protein [Chitinophaga sp. CF118]
MFCQLKSRHLALFLLLFIAGLGCGKEKSYEPPTTPTTEIPGTTGGTAQFSFIASGTNCSDATAAGNYQTGTVLGTDAKVTITVNVTKIGNWTMSTNSLNGISFTGTGTFTATGSQMITLKGIGTPQTAGINLYAFNSGNNTCSVAVATIPGNSDPGSATEYYYKITIDGKTYEQIVTMTNDYEAGSSLSGVDDVTISAGINYYVIGESETPKGKTGFGVTRGTMHNYLNATNNTFKAFFAPGSYKIVKSFADGDGVTIGWLDADGEEWGTEYGTGDQTGSTFNISSISDSPDLTGTFYLKTKMLFKCKLYNKNTGVMKQVTNGEMVGLFGKI